VTLLLASSTGRWATARTTRWAPVVVAPVLVVAATALAARSGPMAADVITGMGLRLVAVTVAFAADDLAGSAAGATPIGPAQRLASRLALVVPAVVLAWAVVAGAAAWLDVPAVVTASAGVTVGLVALATAVAVAARWDVESPGGVGAGAALAGWVVVTLVRAAQG
jgi:hypothetical protein